MSENKNYEMGKDELYGKRQNVAAIIGRAAFPPENKDSGKIIDYFEIPDELAKELSENLIKQSIRQGILENVIGDPVKYEAAEKLLIPVVAKIDAIKVNITRNFVPAKYRSDKYQWNYDGYEIDGNKVQILKA